MLAALAVLALAALAACGDDSSTTRSSDRPERDPGAQTTGARELRVVNRVARPLRVDWLPGDRVAVVPACETRTLHPPADAKLVAVSTSTRSLLAMEGPPTGASVLVRSAAEAELRSGVLPAVECTAEGPGAPPRETGSSFVVVNGSERDVELEWWPPEPAGSPSRGYAVVSACSRRRLRIEPGRYTLGVSSPDGPVQVGWVATRNDDPGPVVVTRAGEVALSGGQIPHAVGCERP